MARKTEKGGKFRNVHCRTWNMARKLKIMENEKHPLDDLKNDEITTCILPTRRETASQRSREIKSTAVISPWSA